MLISLLYFESFLICKTKCVLYSRNYEDEENHYAEWYKKYSNEYIKQQVKELKSNLTQERICYKPDSNTLSQDDWKIALNIDISTPLYSAGIDAIEQLPTAKGIKKQIIPYHFLVSQKVHAYDRLLLCFKALALLESTDKTVDFGIIVYGPFGRKLKVKLAPLLKTVKKILIQIEQLLSSNNEPEFILNRNCEKCTFYCLCKKKALEKNDISLLSGISEKERKKYNNKGIFTVTQLSYTFRPRRRPKKLRDKNEKYHHSLKALSIRENKIHTVGDFSLDINGTPVYVDVEGSPEIDTYYLIGIRYHINGVLTQHSLWADNQNNEQKNWADFLSIIKSIEDPIIIHFGSYESSFFKKMSTRYEKPNENSKVRKSLENAINILSVIYGKVYFPTYSNGLKDIASYLGYKWSETGASGLLSIVWYHEWLQYSIGKDKLLQYNSQDCEALNVLTQFILNLNNMFSCQKDSKIDNNVVQADCINFKKQSKWREFSSPVTAFEKINSAAHWNYQRDRVFIRDKTLKINKKKNVILRSKPRKIDKVVNWKSPLECPKCNKKYYKKGRVAHRTLQDLVFGRNSIKKRIIRYTFQTYICRICKTVYGFPERYTLFRKHGWDMVAYFFYQIIELSIPQLTVTRHFNRMFGYGMHRSSLNNIKTRISEYYSETKESILDCIIAGNLIHADETRANIKGVTAFVWVLTNLKNVVYILSETREGELVQKHLSDFTGVLVSDFYAAYDSINCSQQKCLIHIIRDINDDVLNNPFDEQLKGIATDFAQTLKPMIETVDKYGLKKRFLNKHVSLANRFFAKLNNSEYSSDSASKYKTRFNKNRDKLFTFLNHDGVPWNNNNAEHAIKAFASLRDVISGNSTEKGIDEYLTLLSICQTCKYQGVDFLDFLRSGEKHIANYINNKPKR